MHDICFVINFDWFIPVIKLKTYLDRVTALVNNLIKMYLLTPHIAFYFVSHQIFMNIDNITITNNIVIN